MKICTRCEEEKENSDFCSSRKGDGLQYYCIECVQEYKEEWRRKNPRYNDKYWIRRYNISWEEFQKRLSDQNYECKICGKKLLARADQQIDHSHACCSKHAQSCGKCLRGILCKRCNRVLGFIKDDVLILKAMVKYLRKFKNSDIQ